MGADEVLAAIRSRLADVYRPAGVELWLNSPHRSFAGLSPREAIDTGRGDEVLAKVDQLTVGVST